MVPSPLSVTEPFVGSVPPMIVSVSPSGSLSLARTSTVTAVSGKVLVVSLTASGSWLPPLGSVTQTVTVAVSWPPLPSVIV